MDGLLLTLLSELPFDVPGLFFEFLMKKRLVVVAVVAVVAVVPLLSSIYTQLKCELMK